MVTISPEPTDNPENPTPTSVYLYYDRFGVLIYVGITKRGTTRNLEHNITKDWWSFVARQDVEHYDSRPEALAREKHLIQKHTPPFNRQHNVEHQAIRSAYLLLQQSQSLGQRSIVELLKERQKRLGVEHHYVDGRMAFRTRLSDLTLAPLLALPDTTPHPPVHGMRRKNGDLRITEILHRGPFAVLTTNSQRLHPISGGAAFVKFNNNEGRLILRRLEVFQDHSEGDYCDERCPSHLVGRPRMGAA